MENKIILISVIAALIVSFFMFSNSNLDKQVIPASFSLSDKTGFDLNPGELTFGAITENHSGTRSITVENKFNKPIIVNIKSSGEISKNIIVSENNFIINPQELRNITFSIYTKGLTEFREYIGKVEIISKRA